MKVSERELHVHGRAFLEDDFSLLIQRLEPDPVLLVELSLIHWQDFCAVQGAPWIVGKPRAVIWNDYEVVLELDQDQTLQGCKVLFVRGVLGYALIVDVRQKRCCGSSSLLGPLDP